MDTSVIAVESTANGTYAEGAITITKPTGLAVGDLLLGLFGMVAGNTMTVPSGWTALSNSTSTWGLSNLDVAAMYKVADSSDVAASNFSFDVSDGTGALTGTLFRVSGFNTSSISGGGASASDTSTSSTRSHTIALTPTQTDCILFLAMGCQPNSTITVSSVSSTGSPTWNEVKNETISAGNCWIGYAAYPSVTQITNVSATLNENTNRSDIYLVAIRSQVDSSLSLTLTSTTQSAFAPTESAGTNISLTLTETTQTAFAPTGKGSSPTVWTNEAKGSTTWTNEQEL